MELCGFEVGLDKPFFLIAGTCSIEGLEMSLEWPASSRKSAAVWAFP